MALLKVNQKDSVQKTSVIWFLNTKIFWKNFIKTGICTQKNKPEEFCIKPLNSADELTELVPEAYLDSKKPTPVDVQKNMDKQMRTIVSFMVNFGKENYEN